MGSEDWYRNKNWTPEIESEFLEKLRRARDKSQYLRIQASYLAKSHPNATLDLLERFFSLPDNPEQAQAFSDAAIAYLALGQTGEAIASLRKALKRERQPLSNKTQAGSQFALLVAEQSLESHFDEALGVLAEAQSDLFLRSMQFEWHAAYSLIYAARGERENAREHATQALAVAENTRSGLRNHPRAGLVRDEYDDLKTKLIELSRDGA